MRARYRDDRGAPAPVLYYGCAYHQQRGRTICANDYKARVEEADALVLGKVRGLLTPERIERAVDMAIEELAEHRRSQADRPERLEAELRKALAQRDNLLAALANGKGPKSIVERIATLDAEIAGKERELEALAVEEPSESELRRLRGAFRERLGRFEEFLAADVTIARQALKKVLAGRIEWHPEEHKDVRRYRLRLALRVAPLLDEGHVGASAARGNPLSGNGYNSVASPRGIAYQVNLIPTVWEALVQAA